MCMKVAVYNLRPDEEEFFKKYGKQYKFEIVSIKEEPSIQNVHLAEGCVCVSITSECHITKEMLNAYQEHGIQFISTRTIGYEHIDFEYAKKIGIPVANILYSASSVADYTIMMMLMVLRKVKHIMVRSLGQDYAITKIRGRELPNMTVGIIGTGKIGSALAKHLTGFGCRILAASTREEESLKGIVEYVTHDTLYQESDIITLHLPANEKNYHIINKVAIQKMKEDVILINTSRGPLVDSMALIDALESGKIFGIGLDVLEGDREIYYRDYKYEVIPHREMAILNAMPNVLMLPHMAFYTDQAVSDMVKHSLESCRQFLDGEEVTSIVNG